MHTPRRLFVLALVPLALSACVAQDPVSFEELPPESSQPEASTPLVEDGLTTYVRRKSDPVREFEVHELSWLTGRWVGSGLGGTCEENWNAPLAGEMVGTFRLIDSEGKPSFYEFMTLKPENGTVVLRLVHLSPELKPWEEPGETTDFWLIDTQGTTAWFGGLTLHRAGDQLMVHVAMTSRENGTVDAAMRMQLAP